MRDCVVCGAPFDQNSLAKQMAGGRINQCPDCSEEPAVRYLGLSAGDGKQASLTVLKFESHADREEYRQAFWVNSGMMVGKSCQLGYQKRTPNVKFKTVTQSTATNHKGRA
jgi:NAD-dependent SIR2 family protein deacetylase